MKRKFSIVILILLGAILVGALLSILILKNKKFTQPKSMEEILKKQATESAPKKTGKEKKAALIIAFKDFRDEEFFRTQEVLFSGEIEMKYVSTEKGTAVGADGGEVFVDLTIDDLKVEEFDAIVFIGGPGALKYLDNEKSYKLAKEAVEKNKIVAAICISPTILAKAGVLNGKKVTVWHSSLDKSPIDILRKNGAEFIDERIVQDGNIITGNGPEASQEFGQKILENLQKIQK